MGLTEKIQSAVAWQIYQRHEAAFFESCAFEWSLGPDGTLATIPEGQILIRLWAKDHSPGSIPVIETLHDMADGHNVAIAISGWTGEVCPHFEVVMGGTHPAQTHIFSLRDAPWVNDGDTLRVDISELLHTLRVIYGQGAL